MLFQALKAIHVACAMLSIAGFALRGLMSITGSPLLAARFVRVAPHVVDAVLLASAIALAWLSGQYPFVQQWLTAKVVALVAYIALGVVALKPGRSPAVRRAAFVLALATVLYIVSVAMTRDPWGYFRPLLPA